MSAPLKPRTSVLALTGAFSLSIAGVLVGGPTGTLLLAFSGNVITVVGVYIATSRRRNGDT